MEEMEHLTQITFSTRYRHRFIHLAEQLSPPFKIIIIGSPLSGKTTLHTFMEKYSSLSLYELDLELINLAGGAFPNNKHLRENILLHKACARIFIKQTYIFLTSYVEISLLQSLALKGVTVFQLEADLDELLRRNKQRIDNEGYDDASSFIQENMVFQNSLLRKGLIHHKINAMKPVEEIASNIVQIALNEPKAQK